MFLRQIQGCNKFGAVVVVVVVVGGCLVRLVRPRDTGHLFFLPGNNANLAVKVLILNVIFNF
jgi:hypothetical protein